MVEMAKVFVLFERIRGIIKIFARIPQITMGGNYFTEGVKI